MDHTGHAVQELTLADAPGPERQRSLAHACSHAGSACATTAASGHGSSSSSSSWGGGKEAHIKAGLAGDADPHQGGREVHDGLVEGSGLQRRVLVDRHGGGDHLGSTRSFRRLHVACARPLHLAGVACARALHPGSRLTSRTIIGPAPVPCPAATMPLESPFCECCCSWWG